ncbi:hypothetical protein Hanom_Chr17g01542261 [Helianthus anomalus]
MILRVEMRVKRTDAEVWMSHKMLPEDLMSMNKRKQEVNEESLVHKLPEDLWKDIKLNGQYNRQPNCQIVHVK